MEKKIEQPQQQFQEALDEVLSAEPEKVSFCGKKVSIGWLKKSTIRKFSHIMMKYKDSEKRNVKLCACVLSNDVFAWFKPFVYAVKWRWYWYVKELDDVEVLRVIDASKKKVPYTPSLLITILSTGMTDLMMGMTRKEAFRIQVAQAGDKPTV